MEADGAPALLETVRTVFLPMNLTVEALEFEDGSVVRHLRMHRLDFLPPTFTPFPNA